MNRDDFCKWMDACGYSLQDAADNLGMSRRMVSLYRNGQPIPQTVELACAELSRRKPRRRY